MIDLKDRFIAPGKTIIEALRLMDRLDRKLLIVLDNNKFIGLISAGDIQRAIIQNKSLNTVIKDVLRKNIRVAKFGDSFESIRNTMLDFRMELCPVINEDNNIEHVYFWEDIFLGKKASPLKQFHLDVVIMAGGLGKRLRPLTFVLPKPLIPIGERTILEEIFDRFTHHGTQRFYVSVNYKAALIEFYLQNQQLPYQFELLKEDNPMGTAGSLLLLKNKISKTFFVTNCDILLNQDYSEILDFHYDNCNEITIIAALKHYDIPYGTIETGENGELITLAEKPAITFKINSGMYILEPHLLAEIPKNESLFHMTDLIENIQKRKGKIGVFPVSESSWLDVGTWEEYNNTLKRMNNTSTSFAL